MPDIDRIAATGAVSICWLECRDDASPSADRSLFAFTYRFFRRKLVPQSSQRYGHCPSKLTR